MKSIWQIPFSFIPCSWYDRNLIAYHLFLTVFSFMFRILIMMQIIAARKAENRMSVSAVAACMAPLLLRPLLAGECDIETNIDVGGDGSFQLLQAAAAANHAQAIVITLLEEYDKIFGVSFNYFFLIEQSDFFLLSFPLLLLPSLSLFYFYFIFFRGEGLRHVLLYNTRSNIFT